MGRKGERLERSFLVILSDRRESKDERLEGKAKAKVKAKVKAEEKEEIPKFKHQIPLVENSKIQSTK